MTAFPPRIQLLQAFTERHISKEAGSAHAKRPGWEVFNAYKELHVCIVVLMPFLVIASVETSRFSATRVIPFVAFCAFLAALAFPIQPVIHS